MLQGQNLELYNKISKAIKKFNKFEFNYKLINPLIGYFVVWDSDGQVYQYIADTEEIEGKKETGINDLIRILRGEL